MDRVQNSRRETNLLLVEDNEDDVFIAKHAIRKCRFSKSMVVHVAHDGVEALQFLRHEPPFQESTRPDLVLLDLNMPRMDGRELLNVIKNDAAFKSIPVVILTTSDWEVDIVKAYNAHANSYMTKPVDLAKFADQIDVFLDYWCELSVLPNANSANALGMLAQV